MRVSMQRLAPADEANLVLDHSGQVNVFLVEAEDGLTGFDARNVPDTAFAVAMQNELTRHGDRSMKACFGRDT
ncbi:hypothetical protein [Promicromonospora soli]